MGPAPEPLAAVAELDGAQVVQVAALAVEDLAQEPLPHQVQAEHLRAVIDAVLHHQAEFPGLLRGLEQLPALLQRGAHRHLRDGVLAGPHRRQHHGGVPLPGRGRVHQVDVLLLAHPLEVARAAAVALRAREPGGLDQVLRPGHLGRVDIADGGEARPLDAEQVADMHHSHAAHPHEAEADFLHRRRRQRDRGLDERCGKHFPRTGQGEPQPGSGTHLEQVAAGGQGRGRSVEVGHGRLRWGTRDRLPSIPARLAASRRARQ